MKVVGVDNGGAAIAEVKGGDAIVSYIYFLRVYTFQDKAHPLRKNTERTAKSSGEVLPQSGSSADNRKHPCGILAFTPVKLTR